HLVLMALCIPAMLPMAWMVSTSLKSDSQIYASQSVGVPVVSVASLVPRPVQWRNYPDALNAVPFAVYLKNTLRLCAINVRGAVLSSAIVAYGFARLEFKGKNFLFLLMISTMALPGQVTMIPVFALFRALGWYGTYLPLTVPAFFGSAFYIFLLTQFYK